MDTSQQREPIVLRPAGALFLVFIFVAALISALSLIVSPTSDRLASALALHAAAGVGLLMAMYVGLNRHAPNQDTLPALRLSRPTRTVVPFLVLAVLTGLALGPLGEIVFNYILILWPPPSLSVGQRAQLAQAASPTALVLATGVAANVALVPFLEEAFFRGLLQPNLEKSVGIVRAFTVTLLLFLLPRLLSPQFVPTALLLAAPMGLLALWSRSTWPSVCGHVAFQVSPSLCAWLGVTLVSEDANGTHFLSWGWMLLLTVGAIATLAIARSGRQCAAPEASEEIAT